MEKTQSPLQVIFIGLIKLYQRFISPLLGPHCRFQPTCSQFTLQAIISHGALKGCWLGAKRIGKCHPLHPGGDDPVPLNKSGNK